MPSGGSLWPAISIFFADKAWQEGYAEVAELFERMAAQNEGVHGKLMYQSCGIGKDGGQPSGGDDRGIWGVD